jgi:hypothetical protein
LPLFIAFVCDFRSIFYLSGPSEIILEIYIIVII